MGTLKHTRRSIRLCDYDYSQAGAYFVTICCQGGECLFGEVVNGEMRLNDAGQMIQSVWDELPRHYPNIDIDAFIAMPNHIHGIVILSAVGAGPRACPEDGHTQEGHGHPRGGAPTIISLPEVVHHFKSLTTTHYRHGVIESAWRRFPGRLWQRNYYEHVIRDEESLNRIREYIVHNPLRWTLDRENPHRQGEDAFDRWLATFKKRLDGRPWRPSPALRD